MRLQVHVEFALGARPKRAAKSFGGASSSPSDESLMARGVAAEVAQRPHSSPK